MLAISSFCYLFFAYVRLNWLPVSISRTPRAKFHYAIQVADLVADPVSDQVIDKFVRICDQFATFFGSKAGRRQVRAISTCRDPARTWSQTDSQLAFDELSTDQPVTRTRHAHAGLRLGRRPGLRLDSVMEFGHKYFVSHPIVVSVAKLNLTVHMRLLR